MSVHTNTAILARYGVADLNLEFPELDVPVITGNQRQGDVLLVKITRKRDGGRPIGPGVEVVRSEVGGNTHTLHGAGTWLANDRASDQDLVQGWVSVPADGEAFLIHTEEHNALGIGPGIYEVHRQREFAGKWRRVAD